MKIRIEIEEAVTEEEVIIRCRGLNKQVEAIQKAVSEIIDSAGTLVFFKGDTEYYLSLDTILFFETEGGGVQAHTRNDIYRTKYKLYELEDILPGCFMRVSKSAILNTNHIYSISRSLTASSAVRFEDCHKQVFVSRYYYKPLIQKLEEKRLRQ